GDEAVPAVSGTLLPAREHDPTNGLARNPLLAAWGRDSRELQVVLHSVPAEHHDHSGIAAVAPHPTEGATLLERLQDGVTADRPRASGTSLPVLAPGDRSVQVHRCHG